jgi:hypothetical protein
MQVFFKGNPSSLLEQEAPFRGGGFHNKKKPSNPGGRGIGRSTSSDTVPNLCPPAPRRSECSASEAPHYTGHDTTDDGG